MEAVRLFASRSVSKRPEENKHHLCGASGEKNLESATGIAAECSFCFINHP